MPLTLPPDPRWVWGESDHWAALLNTNQTLLGRCFLVLKRPETDVAALTDAEVTDLWAITRRAKTVLDTLWAPDHYNYAFLMNLDRQVHFHIIPRYRDAREFAGETFVDPQFGSHYGLDERPLETAGYEAILTALRHGF